MKSFFKTPLAQLEEKIETLSEFRMEKLNRAKLAEREKEDLREPMTEAVGFLKLENEITKTKNFVFQKQKSEIEAKSSAYEEDKAGLEEICNKINEKLKATTTEKKKLEHEFQTKNE